MAVNSLCRNLAALALMVLLASGCAPEAQATVAPTLTLIPATATFTPTRIPPTATLQSLTSPEDLLPTAAPSQTAPEDQSLAEIDPVAAELIGVAQRALGQQLNLPTRRIVLEDIQAVTWPDSSLGCPQPGVQYQQTHVNGYRIVLLVAQNPYIYHTDFDRVFLCDPENEVLPAGFEVTAEATVEVTEEAE